MEIKLELDKIDVDDWGESVGDIIKEELKAEIRLQIRAAIKANPNIKKAVTAMQKKAAEQLISLLE